MGKYALFMISTLTFSMLMYSSALRNALFASNTRTIQSYSSVQAQNIAHSAATVVITDLKNNSSSSFNPGKNSSYEYPAENTFKNWSILKGEYNILARNQGDTLLVIRSIGKYLEGRYLVNVGLEYYDGEWNPIIDQAVHADSKISLSGGAKIIGDASINSKEALAVSLGSSTNIDSTLYIGPGGDVDQVVMNKQRVSGDIYNMPKELNYPMPTFPEFPSYAMVASSINTSQTITPSNYENYYIPEIHLTGGAVLNIDTGGEKRVLHTGKFDIQSGQVKITGGGSLEIYIENEIDLSGSSTVNENGDINNLDVFYRGNETVDLADDTVELTGNTLLNGNFFSKNAKVVLNGTSGIQGNVITGGSSISIKGNAEAISRTVYAPYAVVDLAGTAKIRGSVIAKEYTADGNASVIYEDKLDAKLPDLKQEGKDFEIVYWN